MRKPIIAPSILSANFINLGNELLKCKNAGIKMIHFDVMDFDFVPNLTFGSKILSDIVKNFEFDIDIHFMVKIKTKKIVDFFDEFIKCQPKIMTMHIETFTDKKQVQDFIDLCTENKIGASLAVSPSTPLSALEEFFPWLSNVLIMSVNPGFGGQSFIDESLNKVLELKRIKADKKYKFTIEIDGGINDKTAKKAISAGAEILVAGSYLFNSSDFQESLNKFYE